MKPTTKIMFLAGLLAILSAGLAFAEPQGGPGMPGMRPMKGGPGMAQGGPDLMGAIMQKLDLTDQQREKIETIKDESFAKTSAARRAVEKARRELDKAVASDGNEPAIRKAAVALGAAIGDEAVLKAKTMKEIKAVLTPEQLKKLEELKKNMKDRPMPPMRQGRGTPPQGKDGPPQGQLPPSEE